MWNHITFARPQNLTFPSLSLKSVDANQKTYVLGDHGADGAGAEVLGASGGGGLWAGHRWQGKPHLYQKYLSWQGNPLQKYLCRGFLSTYG